MLRCNPGALLRGKYGVKKRTMPIPDKSTFPGLVVPHELTLCVNLVAAP
jgi:hypothetical protein